MPTSISWTHRPGTRGEVWNVVTGCRQVSPGCDHCYAKSLARRFWGDRPFEEVRCHEDRLGIPTRWREPRTIFVNSMSDLFHKDVPDAFIEQTFLIALATPRHTFIVLTKRAERMMRFMVNFTRFYRLPPNLWLGVSAENQAASWRIDCLRSTPAVVKFVSAEPLLNSLRDADLSEMDWVITGGESGPRRRPMDLVWIDEIASKCDARRIPLFIKQDSAAGPGQQGRISDALWARKEFPTTRNDAQGVA